MTWLQTLHLSIAWSRVWLLYLLWRLIQRPLCRRREIVMSGDAALCCEVLAEGVPVLLAPAWR